MRDKGYLYEWGTDIRVCTCCKGTPWRLVECQRTALPDPPKRRLLRRRKKPVEQGSAVTLALFCPECDRDLMQYRNPTPERN